MNLPVPVTGLNQDAPAFEETAQLRRIISSLLSGIATRVSESDAAENGPLQDNVRRTAERIEEVPLSVLLTVARHAIQALDTFGQGEPRIVREHGSELRNTAEMLTRIAGNIGTCLERSQQRLSGIADRLEGTTPEDVRALRARISECCHSARTEAMLQKTDAGEIVAALQQQIAAIQERALAAAGVLDTDAVTGLPNQKAAETALEVLSRKSGKRYVVVAVVNRIQPINARFGHEVGDQVLRTFKESFERQFVPGDRLFRWTGPALMAVLERAETLESVRAEVRRMSDASTGNRMIDVGGRQVMIAITAGWSVFMLIPPVTTAFKQIETFIASQGNRDYA
jgi:diguanylate cyclase (GGDEF)-like protein